MSSDKKLDQNLLFKADIIVLQAIAETIINSMIQNNGSYNSKQYGSIDKYKSWSKNTLIRWLLQFDLKLGNELSKDKPNPIKNENQQIQQQKEELEKQKQELEKQKQEIEQQKQELAELQKLKEEIEKQKMMEL